MDGTFAVSSQSDHFPLCCATAVLSVLPCHAVLTLPENMSW